MRSRHLICAFAMPLLGLALFAEGSSPKPRANPAPADPDLSAYSDVSELWGAGVEAAIERAYRECFRTLPVAGRIRTLRLPFAENSERSELAGAELKVVGGGKANPTELWQAVEELLASADFGAYAAALSDGREKIVSFDLEKKAWATSADRFSIERMLSGRYPGLPHEPAVYSGGGGATDADIYNYLYCVGRVGLDCSGFVWHELKSIAAAGGFDLDSRLGRSIGLPKGAKPSLYVGTWYYDPAKGKTRLVPDSIDKLLPGDIILFRGEDGSFIHSCVIQSIDLGSGRLRYLQSTDECPTDERGVHESVLSFDPANAGASLKDPSVVWSQRRGSTFAGEIAPSFSDDGARYRAYPELGGGVIVRLKALEKTVERLRAKHPWPRVENPRATRVE